MIMWISTEIKDLLTDIDMHLFIEAGIRGGVAVISHRHGQANLAELPNYDPSEPNEHLVYWDANNLYGWAMSQYLPTGDFKWLNNEEIDELNVNRIKDENEYGYIYECDLEYPEELHDKHSDYPLAPERISVKPNMLSDKQMDILECHERQCMIKNGIDSIGPIKPSVVDSFPKLIPNLMDKEKYIVHYRNLKLYMSLGMRIKKIHRVLSFKQSPWLKEYIDFNTRQCTAARNDFEKNFFKLMNNSMFGKTMENLRHRRNIDLVNNEKKLKKLAAQPTFKSFRIFHENLTAVERAQAELMLNRPIYVGFCVLDLSKTLMYDFHYNYVKEKYPKPNSKLMFTDTDSLAYIIKTDDLYADMLADISKVAYGDILSAKSCLTFCKSSPSCLYKKVYSVNRIQLQIKVKLSQFSCLTQPYLFKLLKKVRAFRSVPSCVNRFWMHGRNRNGNVFFPFGSVYIFSLLNRP